MKFYNILQCIAEQYTLHNEGLMAAIDWELDLAGDGRCDSPGHCALYRAYTMMDQSCGLIVSSHLVKVKLWQFLLHSLTKTQIF